MSTIPARNERVAKNRSGGQCEGCLVEYATELHHRKFRSRGGGHEVSNLLHLCGWGNTSGCHGKAHGPNPPQGWAISSGIAVPADVPLIRRGVPVKFDDEGNVLPVSEVSA